MKQIWVFVDVDGTLVDKDDNPRPYVAEFFRRLASLRDVRIVVWSAGLAGSRGTALGDYARQKVASIDFKLNTDIRTHVADFRWKGTPLLLTEPQFFVDDAPDLLEAKLYCGHGTFQVPFYEASLDPAAQDHWLLDAVRAIEDYVWSVQDGTIAQRRTPSDGEESSSATARVDESPSGPIGEAPPNSRKRLRIF